MSAKNNNLPRPATLSVGNRQLELPSFFPSVSSVKTSLPPLEYLRILISTGHPQFLISLHDIKNVTKKSKRRFLSLIAQAYAENRLIMLDSGNYESYWKNDRSWTLQDYLKGISNTPFHIAFSFDDQWPSNSVRQNITIIEKRVMEANKRTSNSTVVPIIHSPVRILPKVVKGVAERLRPLLVAVPERALGNGMVERIQTLVRIRQQLNELGEYIPIHLLGTGNPISILLFSAYGADTFDGLDWCQTTVDYRTGLLYHFQQRELFGGQSPYSSSKGLSYTYATLAHNLLFYRHWMNKIQVAARAGELNNFARKQFPFRFVRQLDQTVGKVTK